MELLFLFALFAGTALIFTDGDTDDAVSQAGTETEPETETGIRISQEDGYTLFGGTEDDDEVFGTDQSDLIRGGDGNDRLGGEDGNDTVSGGTGDDNLFGDDGDDTLSGGTGMDYLWGGADDDALDAGSGSDTAVGGSGDDRILGGTGRDFLTGDVYQIGNGDTSNGDDWIDGGGGDDIIGGNGGTDTLIGGDGNDTILDYDLSSYDGPNASVVDAGDGDDAILVDLGSTIDAGAGQDSISLFGTLGSDVETVLNDFDPDEDVLTIQLEVMSDQGGDLTVSDWADGNGADIRYDDQLVASLAGAQGLTPEDVNLVLTLSEGEGAFADGAGDVALLGNSGDNALSGGAGNDLIDAGRQFPTGNSAPQGGADLLDGGEGDDTLWAVGAEVMPVFGGAGSVSGYRLEIGIDTLLGGAGDDMLLSFNGNEMTGGDGSDTFGIAHQVPDAARGLEISPSVITDFDPAEDRLALQMGPIGSDPAYEEVTVSAWADGTGADVLIDGNVVAQVAGGQSLTPDQIARVQWLGNLTVPSA